MYVEKKSLSFDLLKMSIGMHQIVDHIKNHDAKLTNGDECAELNQISLTHRPGAERKTVDGNGSLYNWRTGVFTEVESAYTEFNEAFKDNYLYEVYQTLVEWAKPLKIGRYRIMRIVPFRCYSLHEDREVRYHIAIETNPLCYLFFAENERGYHIPADGNVYWVDTRKLHTAFNGSPHLRYHLVFTTYE